MLISGGTISKGLNRGFATLLAGALGVGANYLANLIGEKGEPYLLGLFVFILGNIIMLPLICCLCIKSILFIISYILRFNSLLRKK